MTQETAQPLEVIEDKFVAVLKENQIDGPSVITLQGAFAPLFGEAEKWARQVGAINITSVTQIREMKLARETRLAFREIRINAEKKKKELKEGTIRYNRAVDGAFNLLKFFIEPLEERLLEQEKFAERQEEVRVAKLKTDRESQLLPFAIDTSTYQLGLMSDEAFASLLEGTKLADDAKKEKARKDELARIEAENARLLEEKRLRDENAKLTQEKADREAAEQKAREKADAEAKAETARKAAIKAERLAALAPYEVDTAFIDLSALTDPDFTKLLADSKDGFAAAQLKKKQDADKAEADRLGKIRLDAEKKVADENAEKARKDKEKAERDLKAIQDANAEKKRTEAAAAKRAARAPDKTKLKAVAALVRNLALPTASTEEGIALVAKIKSQAEKFAVWIEAEAEKL